MSNTYYMGRPIEELSKEELIEALENSLNQYLESQENYKELEKIATMRYKPLSALSKLLGI